MKKLIFGALAAVVLAACSSTPTKEQAPAAVEERTPASQEAPAPAPGPSPKVTTIERNAAPAGKPLTDPLKDPNNILAKRSVFFDYDSSVVKDEFKPVVTAHADYLKQNKAKKLTIQGNTDERGSREYNLALGQRRADAVKQMMTLLGASDSQIETVSFGEEKPKAEGKDEESYAQNRRDDIVYEGE
jgi:peptidoglycan-associated lipoprotein